MLGYYQGDVNPKPDTLIIASNSGIIILHPILYFSPICQRSNPSCPSSNLQPMIALSEKGISHYLSQSQSSADSIMKKTLGDTRGETRGHVILSSTYIFIKLTVTSVSL